MDEMEHDKLNRRQFVRNVAVGAAGIAAGIGATPQAKAQSGSTSNILNYNEDMEYRRLGSTNLMVSAVCMGGHTGEIDERKEDFEKNRHNVVSRCIEVGINYLDACWGEEVMMYTKALRGRRDKMYLALSHGAKEIRRANYRTSKKLLESLDELLLASKQEYTDLWRVTADERGGRHDFNTSCELIDALEKAKQQGKARFIGFSTHDYRWIKMMVREFPQIDVVLFPYTSMSKRTRVYNTQQDTIFDVLKAHDIGAFGIKPFGGSSLFKGNTLIDSPTAREDNRMARLTLRRILQNPDIIPIPGLSSVHQVDNVARAVIERRELDPKETAELETANREMLARLPEHYQWLKNWEYV
jgi:predicted aldo/keto reductase-like oxidoreductase